VAGGEDPYLRARLRLPGGRRVPYLAPHSVFASHAIDRGTLLLLGHLPAGEPRSFLDLGSGYGVLGLEVAARFPAARGLLLDRDLLAVEFSRRNARLQAAAAVEAAPSLGYRDLPAGYGPFDWILSNLPARAGERVLEALVRGGRARLLPGGALRIVVIAPLAAVVRRLAGSAGIPFEEIVSTPKHSVFGFTPSGAGTAPEETDEVYERDCVRLSLPEELRLVRPSDLADEPHRLRDAIPLLATGLPPEPPARILVFRAGYGLVPALALARYPQARVAAIDRDLLATTFTRRNCAASLGRLRVEEALEISSAPAAEGSFDLVLGELSLPLGPRATLHELGEARRLLGPGGSGLVLGLEKQWKEFLRGAAGELGLSVRATRGPAALFGMSAPPR
jgi:16S rRNA (guanine1207-N2)-methyltransferase